MNTQLISRLSPIADSYDFYIIDLWGTLHNGIEPFPEALDCLKKLKKAGKSIALLSNAPFRVEVVVKVITQIGVPDDLYDNVLSSGEVAWNAIADRSNNSFKSLGKRVVFIGNERHRSMLENPNIEEVKSIKYADFILCTGPRKKSDTIKDYFSELSEAANLSLPMICANPDREVMRGQQREICAGAIAAYYETQHKGAVYWYGKPFRPIFDEMIKLLSHPQRKKVLMIGDGILTDVAGAKGADIDSLFLCGGIHADAIGVDKAGEVKETSLVELLRKYGQAPNFAATHLTW